LKSLIYPYPKLNAKIIDFLIHFQAKASLWLMTYDCSFFVFLDEINSQGLASIPLTVLSSFFSGRISWLLSLSFVDLFTATFKLLP